MELPSFEQMFPVVAEPPRAVVLSSCAERLASWLHALGNRGYVPVPVNSSFEAMIELTRRPAQLLVVDSSRSAVVRTDYLGVLQVCLEENLAREIVVDVMLRSGLKEPWRSDDRLKTHASRLHGARWQGASRKRSVLLAEDDVALRGALSERLERAGYDVVEVRDGIELARACAEVSSTFDVVVSDVKMPRMEGPTALNALVALSPQTPIILMTAYPTDEVYRSAASLGAFCVLEKPTSARTLIDQIESACLNA